MFTIDSGLVQIWARNVITDSNPNGVYTRDQVPNLSNLRVMVYQLLDK